MNTQLIQDRRTASVTTQDVGTLRRPRPPSAPDRPPRSLDRRPSPLDRLALHVGVALIIWGRRNQIQPDRAELIRRHDSWVARQRRELDYQRNWSFNGPHR